MTKGDKNDALERWVRIMIKGHGYAGVFNYDDNDDKRIVEQNTIEEWRASIKAEFGVEMDAPQPNPNDPPDFFVSINGQRLNVELVQLVEEEHKRALLHKSANGRGTPYPRRIHPTASVMGMPRAV
jgi:hypothetical protein